MTDDPEEPDRRAKAAERARGWRARRKAEADQAAPVDSLDKLASDIAEEALRLARGKLFGFAEDEGQNK